jgi:hypothetical protein
VSLTSPGSIPRGWYPDPGGERQWRVWTGEQWSEMTRPYGEPASPAATLVENLPLLRALHRVARYGVVALFAGLGIVVSVLAHWPGTAHPTSSVVAATGLDAGLALLIIGTVSYAVGVRALVGRWTLVAIVPGVNVIALSGLVQERLIGRFMMRRMVSEALLLALFAAQGHAQPWLGIVPAYVALNHLISVQSLTARLAGTATPPASAP